MKVSGVNHWVGKPIPPHLQGQGPFELSLEDFESLTLYYDVMLRRISTPGEDTEFHIFLDDRGRSFRQR